MSEQPIKTTYVPPKSEPPPVSTVGVLGWMKENLFSSVPNTILTVVSLLIVFWALRATIQFVFFDADWTVVTSNLTLYAIGQYPRPQAWRVWGSVLAVAILGVVSALAWNNNDTLRRVLLGLWLISPFAIWIFLSGFSESSLLPRVSTQLWSGLLLTVILTVSGIVLSFPFGVLLALGRRSDLVIIRGICIAFIEGIRGVPLISILFMAQVMLPLFVGFNIDVVLRAIAGVTIFSAAYLAEIVRGGLQAIPSGQVEAAQALGLNAPLITGLIVLPQALRIVIPAIVGQFISLFKDTTLVSIITLLDLLGIAETALAQRPEFQSHKIEAYVFIAMIYFVLSYIMSAAARRIESSGMGVGN